ncbi:hypothetical protein [Luteimonas notoginsengisoli]|uniref:KTSC domain-containing protein n=1 Tax=Luteimonas notoginsengisoli TaxID=1578200 RepID=A0ABV7UUD3_9GAMM
MHRYSDTTGGSGVEAFELCPDAILVRFRDSDRVYRYSHRTAGRARVDEMKRLALAGRGLATFISRHASDLYER